MTSEQEVNWEQLIKEQDASGTTISAFCVSRGISEDRFKKRKYSIKAASRPNSDRFNECIYQKTPNIEKDWILKKRVGVQHLRFFPLV